VAEAYWNLLCLSNKHNLGRSENDVISVIANIAAFINWIYVIYKELHGFQDIRTGFF